MNVKVPVWTPLKVVLELPAGEAGALLRACQIINRDDLLKEDFGAQITIKELEAKLRAMFNSNVEGHAP